MPQLIADRDVAILAILATAGTIRPDDITRLHADLWSTSNDRVHQELNRLSQKSLPLGQLEEETFIIPATKKKSRTKEPRPSLRLIRGGRPDK